MSALFLSFMILLVIGVPMAFSLGLSAFVFSWSQGGHTLLAIPLQMFASVDQFVFMAIPLFMLSGELMVTTGIMDRLLNFAMVFLGRFRGSLALVAIVCSMVFAGISGSAVADAAAIGAILIPAMGKKYDAAFGAGVVTASSVIGPILPPSIPMIVYAMATGGVSIGALFMAGIIPGLLIGCGMMVIAWRLAVKRGYPRDAATHSGKDIARLFLKVLPTLLMPVIIVGGIRGGIVTPTEAAAVAVLYAVILGAFMRTLTLRGIWGCLVRAAKISSMVFLVIATASVIAWMMAEMQLPEKIAAGFRNITDNPYLFILMLNVFLLVVGCFMEPSSAMIMLMPLIAPIAYSYGLHPVHLGMIVVLNLCMGMITPPVGTCLFVSCGIARLPVPAVARAMMPFFLYQLGVLALISFVPEVVLWLPRVCGNL